MNNLNIVLLGCTGSGKGTQAAKLAAEYNLVHLSTGEIFRANMAAETEMGNLAKTFIDKGKLVPDDVTIQLLQTEVEKYKLCNGFIFDGFPRTPHQAQALDQLLNTMSASVTIALSLEVTEKELTTRLLLRGREDDTEELIRERISIYNHNVYLVKEFYNQSGKLCLITGEGNEESIFELIGMAIDNYSKWRIEKN